MPRNLTNLRWALRSLLKTPGFTAMAILILALGIGANAAIFSLVDRVMLQPLPYRDPGSLVAVWGANVVRGRDQNPLSAPDFLDWQREASQVEGLSAVDTHGTNLTGAGEPRQLIAGRVSWNFFKVIGVHPVLGRDFLPDEDRAEGPKAVILTDEFWKEQFGGDSLLVGRSIRLDGQDAQVVGILPPGFSFQHGLGGAQVLTPMAFAPHELSERGMHFTRAVARLKPGATPASCEADFKAIAARLTKAYPGTNANFTAHVLPLHAQLVQNSRGTLLMLLGAVACVLLIACANLMNLMLARGARRQREMAIRAALGAGPGSLVGSALAESLVLGLLGGAAGLLLARWTLGGLVSVLGKLGPGLKDLPMEPRLMGFTIALSVAASLLFGFVPALKMEGRHLADSLKEGKGTGGSSHPRLRGLLVISEMALATALLIGAGLMIRSLRHLSTVDPGFQADHVLTTRINLPSYKYADLKARAAFIDRLLARLAASPGVVAAAVNDTLPFQGDSSTSGYDLGGHGLNDGREALNHSISPGYFRTLGIPILRGRDFAPGETDAVIINEALAKRDFPNSDPLDGRISFDAAKEPFHLVVGVVGSVRHADLAQEPKPEMYFPAGAGQSGGLDMQRFVVAIQTQSAPGAMAATLRQALRELDPDLPLGNTRTLSKALAIGRQSAKARSILLGAFAGLALLLAGVGIFAVINFLTALRTREIGIRMALGAQVSDVLKLVLGQGLRLAALGIGAGVALALALGRFLGALLAGVTFWDPSTLGTTVTVLFAVGVAACLLPALKATKVDPMVALRND